MVIVPDILTQFGKCSVGTESRSLLDVEEMDQGIGKRKGVLKYAPCCMEEVATHQEIRRAGMPIFAAGLADLQRAYRCLIRSLEPFLEPRVSVQLDLHNHDA